GLSGAGSVVVSADGKSVYAASVSDNAIVRFTRNTTSGALNPRGCIGDIDNNPDGCAQTAAGLANARSVVVTADGKSVYAASVDDNAIVRFTRNTTSGAL